MRFSTSMTDGAPLGIATVAALAAALGADLRERGRSFAIHDFATHFR
jgi:hypothetical protein